MVSQTFRPIQRLPFEIHRLIWLAAMPSPRLVHIHKKRTENWYDFWKRMNDLPEPEEVDSSLKSPSDNYDGHAPYSSSQTQLEQYAFTSSKPAPDLLDIPIGDNKITKITMYYYLQSTSPVPVLLHACAESRHVMQKAGYELAFRNARYGPRTWFSYQHDILYLVENNYFNGLHPLPGPEFLDGVWS
jgi:hypothetical protein